MKLEGYQYDLPIMRMCLVVRTGDPSWRCQSDVEFAEIVSVHAFMHPLYRVGRGPGSILDSTRAWMGAEG